MVGGNAQELVIGRGVAKLFHDTTISNVARFGDFYFLHHWPIATTTLHRVGGMPTIVCRVVDHFDCPIVIALQFPSKIVTFIGVGNEAEPYAPKDPFHRESDEMGAIGLFDGFGCSAYKWFILRRRLPVGVVEEQFGAIIGHGRIETNKGVGTRCEKEIFAVILSEIATADSSFELSHTIAAGI